MIKMADKKEMATIIASDIAVYNARVNAFNSKPLYFGGDFREKKFNQLREKLILRCLHHFPNFNQDIISKIKTGSLFAKDVIHGETDRDLIIDELLGVNQEGLFDKNIKYQD